jgi:deoxyribodipyrimidine photo-lyase
MQAKKSSEPNTAIWWIRRDLRLSDNQALQLALEKGYQIAPVFILDRQLMTSPFTGEKRLAFLFEGLRALDASLQRRGSYLIIRQGDPVVELKSLAGECSAVAIYAEPDVSPYARSRDERVEKELPVRWVGSPAVLPPGLVLNKLRRPYTVFTPFSKAWRVALQLQPGLHWDTPEYIPTPSGLSTMPHPAQSTVMDVIPFRAGEAEAERCLRHFIGLDGRIEGPVDDAPIFKYLDNRDRLSAETSMLSPYLRFGMLSARQAVMGALSSIKSVPDESARKSAETWLNELVWRDFYLQVLYYFPHVRERNFRTQSVCWVNNQDDFETWKTGLTGYPLVDAAMRQLVQTGWLHNRARMVVASFLTKDLLIDWRWGEQWFMQHLIDGDPALNNGGWQWVAGTGTDAAPFFRIFNPVTQSRKHDPHGQYIRRWLPELASVPDKFIHQPWLMSAEEQKSARVKIGADYPSPIVDHDLARKCALAAYRAQ